MTYIYRLFDRIEDVFRRKLSQFPIFYGFIGGAGVVLFWRGVWHTADWIMEYYFFENLDATNLHAAGLPWWDGPLSILVGSGILLITGIFVSAFIGNEIIISGLRGEKKLAEKTADEVRTETGAIAEIQEDLRNITKKLDQIK